MTDREHVIIVLANLMNADGVLNEETADRVRLGCATCDAEKANRLIFAGWPYRADCNLPIAQAMKSFASAEGLCDPGRITLNTLSRDTAGDAILTRAQCTALDAAVTVVTSDYHVERTAHIFSTCWGRQIRVVGSSTPQPVRRDTEAASRSAFDKTFAGVDASALDALLDRLQTAHPFYNGEHFPMRPFPWGKIPALLESPFGDW